MTLMSIVGEDISRIAPVLFAYRNQFKNHVLLCDDEPSNIQRAKSLKNGMRRFSNKNSLSWCVRIVSTNEDSAEAIKRAAESSFDNSNELWLNATDGYPAITVILSEFVRNEGGKILCYDHFDNDLHVIDENGDMITEKLISRIDLESYIMMLDYRIVDISTKKQLISRKKHILPLFENIDRFRALRKRLMAEMLHGKSYPRERYEDLLVHLQALHITGEDKILIKSQQKVLQGDLAEEYLFWLCEELNPDDIALGVKIDFDDLEKEPEDNRRVINEFDIILVDNNRIFAIESKFSKDLNGLDFIYKYDAIIDYFGSATKAIIVNISTREKEPYMEMKVSVNFRHSALRRARRSGISIYHESRIDPARFQDLVKNFFHIGG